MLLSFLFLNHFFKIYLLIYFWLHWVFVAVCRLFLVAMSRGYSLIVPHWLLIEWLLLLRSTWALGHDGLVVPAPGL